MALRKDCASRFLSVPTAKSGLNLRLGDLNVLGGSNIRESCLEKFALRRVLLVLRTCPLGLTPYPRTASEIIRLARHC
jgi:hypothetical protein